MAKNFKTILLATFVAGLALTLVSGLQYASARLSNTSPTVSTAGFLVSPVTDADVPNNITIDLATSASDLTCTDCINATEIENIYLLLAGGTLTGNLVGTGASFSTGLELTGDKRLSINAGAFTDTSLEIGGTASISGAVTLKGAITGATSYNGLVITADIGSITTGTWNGTAIDEAKIDWVVTTQAIDFGGATSFEAPNGVSITVNAEGEMGTDESGFGQLVYYASASEHVLTDESKMSVAIPSTSFNYFSSISLMDYAFRGLTIKRIQCRVVGGTSIVTNFEDGSNNDMDSLTCATTNTFDDGSILNSTLTKAERLVLEKGTVTGAVNWWYITATYVETRE